MANEFDMDEVTYTATTSQAINITLSDDAYALTGSIIKLTDAIQRLSSKI